MNLTLAELEHYLQVAAYIVVRHGDAYVHTFERLEKEVEIARSKSGKLERAQQVLADMMRKGVRGGASAT